MIVMAILGLAAARSWPTPRWPPTYDMRLSSTVMPCNHTGYFDPTMDNCHESYWGVYILPFIFYGGCMLFFAWRNMNRHKLKEEIEQRLSEALAQERDRQGDEKNDDDVEAGGEIQIHEGNNAGQEGAEAEQFQAAAEPEPPVEPSSDGPHQTFHCRAPPMFGQTSKKPENKQTIEV